jgi:hypothetical protein
MPAQNLQRKQQNRLKNIMLTYPQENSKNKIKTEILSHGYILSKINITACQNRVPSSKEDIYNNPYTPILRK